MGQKVNPVGLRVGVIRDWESKWYAGKDFGDLLMEDVKIREFLKNKLKDSAVSRVEIERAANRVNVTIHTAKPGMVIGKGGSEVENLRNQITKIAGGKKYTSTSLKLKPRPGRDPGSRKHCTTIGTSCFFPSCSETSYSKNYALWC